MKITILQTGIVPVSLRDRFAPYGEMFKDMFALSGERFEFAVVDVLGGEPLPAPEGLEGIVITGSSAGVYEDHAWLPPLRAFIRAAYAAKVPMVGICFGHQIMADALGGTVEKSHKGWGLGRHSYDVVGRPSYMADAPALLSITCSHQDQVITPPEGAEVILKSEFTPNAGLTYANGAALSFQPHPEFEDDYMLELAHLRRGKAADAVVDAALASEAIPSDRAYMAKTIARFFLARG